MSSGFNYIFSSTKGYSKWWNTAGSTLSTSTRIDNLTRSCAATECFFQ
jgi:hypothetical protein